MKSKKELENELRFLDAEIQATNENLRKLELRRQELTKAMAAVNESEATHSLLNSIFEINQDNAIYCTLSSNTKTTPIIDSFYHSEMPYLVFENMFELVNDTGFAKVSLVISKSHVGVKYHNSGLTMTDLKKVSQSYFFKSTLDFSQPESRKYPLYQELDTINKRMQLGEKAKAFPFQMPCLLGGQTYSNQSGYGSAYYGDDLVYEGTLYGETTKFLIIGVIVENSFFK